MGSAIDLSDINRYEITEVYADPDALVDIVLVHGLNGHPRKTWTTPASKKTKREVFWPTDLLPVTLKSAKARILVYGYNADVYAFNGSASSDMMHQHAQTLLANLTAERKLEERMDVPILWVAHSLGGILVKRALNLSSGLHDEKRAIYVSTYGIIFLGTPHTGADAAKWGHILQSIGDALIPKRFMDTEPHLLRTLKSNNETLQNINLQFLDICSSFEMNMIHEAVKTDLGGTKSFIVDQESASPLLPNVTYYGIEATHSGMCKFETKNSPGYTNVSGTLKSWVIESPKKIKQRVEFAKEARIRKARETASQLLADISPETPRTVDDTQIVKPNRLAPHEDSSTSNEGLTQMVQSVISIEPDKDNVNPFVITPPGFRPNSLFVGRETQLMELDKTLFDKKRRVEGTSACLLQSLPGGGKTHLAREYLYSHTDKFPGGVFWVNAKSQQQLELGYWDIYRRVVISRKDGGSSPGSPVDDFLVNQNTDDFIEVVTEWFRQNHQWLLVLDGIHFHHTRDLRRFIPDSVDCSLIYTSTERSVSGDHHFMNPQVITVPPLSAVEAQHLFLLELDRKNPSKDDLKCSMELVQMMGFNPLVIHTVAQRLKRTRETLPQFTRSYSSERMLRGLEPYKAIIDELKHCDAIEALSLIYILCFFSQHIPVEMISLGLNRLDVNIQATEPDNGTSLNNTFTVLNSFALVERNEPEETVRSSQSSQSSRTMLVDNIDMIRIHSVVQDFFVDSLRAANELPYWLAQAIKLFCASYDHADARIKKRSSKGLVEDYRRFHVHGDRLREHVHRSEKVIRFDAEIKSQLKKTLDSIKEEIEGRTPESSQQIARGNPEAFQTSVFDRTSSSSDAGPETPDTFERRNTGLSTNLWGLESAKEELRSPASITHEHSRVTTKSDLSRSSFPPLPHDDHGYDTDDDYNMSESATVRGDNGILREREPWQTVLPRGGRNRKTRPANLLLQHRTIKAMDRGRYHDSVGAWRSVATDPRVQNIPAQGIFQSKSRDRSSAEDSLSIINAKSPPPIRGGGIFIKDRGTSTIRFKASEPRKIMAGMASYASAVAGHTPRPNSSHSQRAQGFGSPQGSSTTGMSPATHTFLGDSEQRKNAEGRPVRPPLSAAMTSLQSIPTLSATGPQNQSGTGQSRQKIPPPTFQLPYPQSDAFIPEAGPIVGQDSRANPPAYGRNTKPLPYERVAPSFDLPTRKRNSPHDFIDYPAWQTHHYPETTSSSPGPSFSSYNSPLQPKWSSNLENTPFNMLPHDHLSRHQSGYTSQPMSRDPSGQSGHTNITTNRRPSIAETEPAPHLPNFSPPMAQQQQRRKVSQTAYYDQRAEMKRGSSSGEREMGVTRKSPTLGLTAGRMIKQRSNPISRSNTPFNAAALPFYPGNGNQNTREPNIAFSNVGSQFPSLPGIQFNPQLQHQGFRSEDATAAGMERTGSGGIRVGEGRYVQFGDYYIPEFSEDASPHAFSARNRRPSSENLEWGVQSEMQGHGKGEKRGREGAAFMPRTGSGVEISRFDYGGTEAGGGGGQGSRVSTRERSLSNPERLMTGSAPVPGSGSSFDMRMRGRGRNMERDRREYGWRRT